MKQKNKAVTLHEVRLLFENFQNCSPGCRQSGRGFFPAKKIDAYLSDASWNAEGVRGW